MAINKFSDEISNLKWSQPVELANMEMKYAEKLKIMRKSMKGQGSRWDSGKKMTLRICDVIPYNVHVLWLSFNVSKVIIQ